MMIVLEDRVFVINEERKREREKKNRCERSGVQNAKFEKFVEFFFAYAIWLLFIYWIWLFLFIVHYVDFSCAF
jgi:hypothetical protein